MHEYIVFHWMQYFLHTLWTPPKCSTLLQNFILFWILNFEINHHKFSRWLQKMMVIPFYLSTILLVYLKHESQFNELDQDQTIFEPGSRNLHPLAYNPLCFLDSLTNSQVLFFLWIHLIIHRRQSFHTFFIFKCPLRVFGCEYCNPSAKFLA